MRNPSLDRLDGLIGSWTVTLSDAWFLEPAGTEVHGRATFEWLADAFVVMACELGGHPGYELVIGYSDARGEYTALYHDERGVSRRFAMTYDAVGWTMSREDPDFHQRFVATVEQDAVRGRWEASDDQGHTWRKDFDLTFVRDTGRPPAHGPRPTDVSP
ncbi:hypothetical protein [Nocardiopsis sp. YSL2]|uniref:hypothetical protein n=1 Tax=Nocardiopsis sp. YSL2 TaxID=2939492 RepID=UPI0026F43740|nr:hypothetical protein [Nocardiopsis sp. YSL2]